MNPILDKTQPSPSTQANLQRRYRQCYERIAEEDLVKPLEGNKHVRNVPFLRMIGEVRGKTVLDVGSAQGLVLDGLRTAALTVCVDLAQAYMRVARERGHQAVVGDGEALPFRAGAFDVVICTGVLEHVLNAEAVVRQVERILKPDGSLFVLVPWKEDLGKYEAFEGVYEFTHLRSFDEEAIRKLFRSFRIAKRRGVEPKIERPPHLKLLDCFPAFVGRFFQFAGRIGRRVPWRLQKYYWKAHYAYWGWYWGQLARLPAWDWLWLWFYPPFHMIFEFKPRTSQDVSGRRP
ncbi:MAG TPA: class I SAM-dependent methyltransferase [Chloroflexota bacterium]|jgi:SAM-dependent methyltransferase